MAASGRPPGRRLPAISTWPASACRCRRSRARPRCGRRRRARRARRSRRRGRRSETSKNTPSRVRRLTSRTVSPTCASCFGNSAERSRPTMRRTISSVVMSAVRASWTTAPSRMTVTVSQIANTSSRRCEMNRTAAPCSCSAAHDREQPRDLGPRQRRGRLVHDQHARVEAQRLGDLDDLLVGDREPAHGALGIEADAEAVEQRLDLAAACAPRSIRLSAAQRVEAHDDVLRDAEVGEQRRLLVDDGDAGVARRVRGVEVDLGAVDEHRAGVAPDHAAEHLHERRLARAVLADQRAHLAGPEAEVGVAQRADGAVGLRGVAQLDDRGGALAHERAGQPKAGALWSIFMASPPFRPITIKTKRKSRVKSHTSDRSDGAAGSCTQPCDSAWQSRR